MVVIWIKNKTVRSWLGLIRGPCHMIWGGRIHPLPLDKNLGPRVFKTFFISVFIQNKNKISLPARHLQ